MSDLEKPRPPVNALGFFLSVCTEQWNKKHPDEKIGPFHLEETCDKKWKIMTDFQKIRFYQMEKCDEQRYDKEMAAYNEAKKTKTEVKKAEKKEEKRKEVQTKKEQKAKEKEEQKRLKEEQKAAKKKKKKDPNAPKNARTSYLFFCNEVRERLKVEQPELAITEVGKEAGKLWKELSPSKKAKYEAMAAEDKLRYEREKAQYEAGTFNPSGVQTIPEMLNRTANMSPSKSAGGSPSKKAAAKANESDSSSSSDSDD